MKKLLVIMSVMAMMLTMASCGGTEIVEEEPVETAYVDTVYWGNGYPDKNNSTEYGEYREITDVMLDTEAQFFYIENNNHNYDVYQTDKTTFDEKAETVPKSSKASKTITDGLKTFLNSDYSKITDDYNTWFKGMTVMDEEMHKSKDYITDNKIILSCETVNPERLGIMHYGYTDTDPEGNPCTPQNSYYYFFVGTADVTTVEKASDPNGYFPEVGETETITIKAFFYNNDTDRMFAIDGLFFE